MWESYYGKEPFDLRLCVLRMLRQWKTVLLCTLAGTIVLAGAYCVKNYLFRGPKEYRTEITYRVDYGVEDLRVGEVCVNYATWEAYVHTDLFVEMVQKKLAGSPYENLSKEECNHVITTDLKSDWRVLTTFVTSVDAQLSDAVAMAVASAIVEDFPDYISEIREISVIDVIPAKEVILDVRPGRAVILSVVVSLFVTMVVLLLRELGEDAIWLPVTLQKRYGIKTVGTVKRAELCCDLNYLFSENEQIILCPVQEAINIADVESCLKTCYHDKKLSTVPSPILCPEVTGALREAKGCLLVVKAGSHAGKQTEIVLDYLSKQDCEVKATLLWDADERLIREYYCFSKQ